MESYRFIIYIIFGLLPSLVWLFYYLQKDLHPEPKKLILKIFLFGALSTAPVLLIQIGLSQLLAVFETWDFFIQHQIAVEIIKWFFIIALTEEFFKFMVVKLAILNNPELDEPLDIMLYMVVAALGFAALENMLYLFAPAQGLSLNIILRNAAAISAIRFMGATFLHTLCSGLLGYFLALSSLRSHRRLHLTVIGIILAVALHGAYDFSIITLQAPFNAIIPIVIIFILTIFMAYDFDEIKKVKSICKI